MRRLSAFTFLFFVLVSCKHKEAPKAAFYYWKTVFNIDSLQSGLLTKAGNNTLYLRFFDITWDEQKHTARPIAVVHTDTNLAGIKVTPVIFITNRVFEHVRVSDVDS